MSIFSILFGLILFLLILSLIPFKLDIQLEYQNNPAGKINIKIRTFIKDFWKEIHYEGFDIENLLIKKPDYKGAPVERDSKKSPQSNWRLYYGVFKKAATGVHIMLLKWHTHIGWDDAMETALTAGALWAVKGGFLGIVTGFFPLHHLDVQVLPVFTQRFFLSQAHCILKVRIVHIIFIGLWFIFAKIFYTISH